MRKDCLAGHQGSPNHDDWWWPLSYVPRAWTSFCRGPFARPPSYWRGNLEVGVPGHFKLYENDAGAKVWYPNDLPPAGRWWIGWPPYWAWTRRTRDALQHWRLGFRYTTTTAGPPTWAPTPGHNYYNFPAGPAIREISPDLAHALSRQQLRNHLLHGLVAGGLTVAILAFTLPPWAQAAALVVAVSGVKEWVEVVYRLRRGQVVHWWDGVLDLAGWTFFMILAILTWRWLT